MFKRTPTGTKTDHMLRVEARIGRSLEEDYRDYYLERGWGQKRLADRWGVKRATVFESNARSRRRSWVEMLHLPTRDVGEAAQPPQPPRTTCESCGECSVPLERAHWLPASHCGISASDNIVLLCPNCHTKLDHVQDPGTIERVRAALLHRTARRVLGVKGVTADQFMIICKRILEARK